MASLDSQHFLKVFCNSLFYHHENVLLLINTIKKKVQNPPYPYDSPRPVAHSDKLKPTCGIQQKND